MTSQDPGPKGPGQFRMILRYKPQASSAKLQAPRPALMMPQLKNRMKLESMKVKEALKIKYLLV